MKKSLLFFGALALASVTNAQIYSENFEGGTIPTGWGVTTNATDGGWNVGTSGTLGSLYFPMDGNSTRFAGTNDDDCNCDKSNDFLYTAAIDLSAQAGGTVFMKFKQYYFDALYQGAQESAKIEFSTDGGSTWSVGYQLTGAGGWTDVTYNISSFAGQNIMVGFRYNDGGGWLYGLGIDDFSVIVPDNEDVTLTALDLPNYSKLSNGAVDIKGSYFNNGGAPITSMDVQYTVNGGTPVVANLTGLNIAPLSGGSFTHTTPWTPSADGDYTIEVKIIGVNGSIDSDISDNVLSDDITIYTNSYPRVVLFETFTSSTCAPCTPGNANFESVISGIPSSDYASVKYQMSWPGAGDPYNTADGNARRTYYGVSSVPNLEIDGGWAGNSNSFTINEYDDAAEIPAFVQIDAEYSVQVDEQKVRTCATINAMQDMGSATLQIAIIEGKTTQNVESNGETEFYHVLKKMVPNANGQSVTITDGMNQTICEDYIFQGNYRLPNNASDLINDATEHSVEEFTDLQVVVWLENNKVVYNAANAVEGITSVNSIDNSLSNVKLYPNPAVNNTTLEISAEQAGPLAIRIYDMTGRSIQQLNQSVSVGTNVINLNTQKLSNGVYFVEVSSNNNTTTERLVIQK